MMLRNVIFAALIIGASLFGVNTSPPEQPLKPVSVCEALKNRKSYNGKMVAVIGLWSATDEGRWLVDKCEQKIRTEDYLWPDVISLGYDPAAPSAFKGKMPLDVAVARKEIEEMKGRLGPRADKAGWAVVYGRFETHEELRAVVAGDGKTVYGDGFGHLNGSPAQVVYKDRDITFISAK